MKLGLISDSRDCPVGKALSQLATTLYQIDVEMISSGDFKPAMVEEKSLEAVLLEGGTSLSEAQAIAVKKNVRVPVLYFSHGKTETPLAQYGIEVYRPFGKETGGLQLFARLKELA